MELTTILVICIVMGVVFVTILLPCILRNYITRRITPDEN